MVALRLSRVLAVGLLLALSACATQPENINNICSVFDQRDGWFTDWHSGAQRAERKYGVPVPVLMATLRKESGFQANAKPPRTRLFGFIICYSSARIIAQSSLRYRPYLKFHKPLAGTNAGWWSFIVLSD